MNHVNRSMPLLLLLATGCTAAHPWRPVDDLGAPLVATPREREMEKSLPDGLRLNTSFRKDFQGEITSVLHKLRELGACCKDGKLYDRNGKELYFYWVPDCPVPRTREQFKMDAEAEQRQLEELEHRFHVIYMYHVVRPC